MAEKCLYRKRGDVLDICQEPGDKFHPEYEIKVDENGHKTLVETGEHTNRYAKIQEDLESTKIENIIKRAQLGDPEALSRKEGMYLDLTELPQSFREAQDKIIKIKNEFEKLPIDIRRQFDMSPEKYIQEFGSEDWMKVMGFVKETEVEKPVETPVEKENKNE